MKILILNALEWGAEYDSDPHPRDVGQWFIEAFGEQVAEFYLWRIQQESSPPPGDFDGVVIGGSFASVFDDLPWIRLLERWIRDWMQQADKAILGVCFGHQLIARMLGGKVERNPAGWECGTLPVSLTEVGRNDPLFRDLPESFLTLQAHQDAVLELPPGAERLAGSRLSQVQSFRMGSRIRTVQFHPEFTDERMRYIFSPRRSMMENAGIDFDFFLKSLFSTPHCLKIFRNFLNEIV